MMIKAIETVYNGYRFRSRLEARWAVFFDALGVEYQYEVEGFEFQNQRYLPDFWLPKFEVWIEIKPNKGSEITFEYRCKLRDFSKESEKPLIILQGEPYLWAFDVVVFPDSFASWGAGVTSFSFVDFVFYTSTRTDPPTEILVISFIKENGHLVGHVPLGQVSNSSKNSDIDQAYLSARQARF